MSDVVDPATRSRMMSGIRSKDTRPERFVRSALHRLGFRFRLHRPDVPGKPDLVLPRFQAVVFVHGCFWHRHEGCCYATTPSTNPDFWREKFRRNTKRDQAVQRRLADLGWRVLIVWECGIKHDPEGTIDELVGWIQNRCSTEQIEVPVVPPRLSRT